MPPTSIMTARWWVDCTAVTAWELLADLGGWPRWWSALAALRVVRGDPMAPAGWPVAWSALLGQPLSLVVSRLSRQAPQWLSLHLQGDLRSQLTWVLDTSLPQGVDITCRLELRQPGGWARWVWPLAGLWVEHRVFALMRSLALDMGSALRCGVTVPREWRSAARG